MRKMDIAPDIDFDKLVTLTDGYSGADLFIICRDAANERLTEMLNKTGFNIADMAN